MKINLTLNSPVLRSGFINIDPLAPPSWGKVVTSVSNLDIVADDAEATQIVANDVLDFFPPQDKEDIILHWVSKLHYGGTITIGGVDIREVARRLTNHQIDITQANILLYGEQNEPWNSRKATISLPLLRDQLKRMGLVILQQTYKDMMYSVTAKRKPPDEF